jgi:Telomere capping, CST complex subunit
VVDVNLVIETVESGLLDNGSWVNVIGYVQGGPQLQNKAKTKRSGIPSRNTGHKALVQAVLIWDAGAIKANEYEKTLEQQREARRKTRNLHEGTNTR